MSQVLIETPISTFTYGNKHNIICCNCGGFGHVYARCNHPVTSYGVICYRLDKNRNPEYLMVQRKDSLSYVEFMRGKYNLQHVSYMMSLFENMTEEERVWVSTKDFDDLWTTLWSSNSKNFIKEYNQSKDKFQKLQKGYILKTKKNELIRIDFAYLYKNTKCDKAESEWGFPKGRRSFSDEDDKRCALREFREETCMNLSSIRLLKEVKPFEEVFTGSNKVRYKHVYYIARHSNLSEDTCGVDPNNKHQAREIKDVKWFSYDEAQEKIGNGNIERKELLKRVHKHIMRQPLDYKNYVR